MKPIRVLVVGMTATAGGVENFLMAYCSRIDPQRIRFDFLTRYEDAAYPEGRRALGKTYVIPRRSEEPVKYYREIRAFFEAHAREYDVIWDNECMFSDMTPLKMAAEFDIPVRIAHSHNPQNADPSLAGKGRGALHRAQRRSLARYANMLWACTEESARWACPSLDLPFAVIPPAIDAQEYRFDARVRQEVRAHYGLSDCLVVGHVGRLAYQKNHTFLLEAFARLHQREPRARLVLAGDGPNLLSLEAKAVELGVEDEVLFLGQRDDVRRLLQAFDLCAMPSHFEGLGMAAVEAQAAGLPCLLSDAFPKEAAITPDVRFLPPEDPDLWAERMLDMLEGLAERVRPDTLQRITDAGYEMREASERLTQRFEQLVRENPGFKRRFLLTTAAAPADALAEKARADVQQIASACGYAMLAPAAVSLTGKWWQKASALGRIVLDWAKLFFKLRHGDLLLVQYPWQPVEAAPIARWALHLMQWKGAKTAAFLHDLDSLRLPGHPAGRWSDQELLCCFDRVIAQDGRMATYLTGQGIKPEALVPLQMGDYLTDAPVPRRALEMSVCVAGDLARKRSPYLHQIPRTKLCWHLYGEGWKGKASRTDLIWHGSDLAAPEGTFGLCWEGKETGAVTGAAGAYMMLAYPRKMSLYLACGMPVIVWKWSAMAEFVRRNNLGLVVDNLADVPGAVAALTAEAYDVMAASARAWGEKLRRGDMTRDALDRLG